MRKTIAFEVDDELFDTYLRPLLQQRKLSQLVSQFFDLYGSSKEVRQYFDNINAIGQEKRIKKLESIINDKDFLARIGILDAEIDDIGAQARNAKRGVSLDTEEDNGYFSFEGDDEPVSNGNYATKADIDRLEDMMSQLLTAINSGVIIQQTGAGQQTKNAMQPEKLEKDEEAEQSLANLSEMFSF